MKDIRMKAFHRGIRQIFNVTGFMGYGDQAKVYADITSFKRDIAEIMLFTGKIDMNDEPVYEDFIVSYQIGKKELVVGFIEFEDACFKLKYEVRIRSEKKGGEDRFETRELLKWDSKKIKVLGNKYQNGVMLQANLISEEI